MTMMSLNAEMQNFDKNAEMAMVSLIEKCPGQKLSNDTAAIFNEKMILS